MASDELERAETAKLNEIIDVLGALSAGRLRDILKVPGGAVKGCDYDCDCNHSYCTCRGSVSSKFEHLSFPEYLEMRERRMAELKEQLAALDVPSDLKK